MTHSKIIARLATKKIDVPDEPVASEQRNIRAIEMLEANGAMLDINGK